jgi:hypothetical protein
LKIKKELKEIVHEIEGDREGFLGHEGSNQVQKNEIP